jgi:two-component system, NtrC family, nitrogen regulation sensor histidine kinase NtrY
MISRRKTGKKAGIQLFAAVLCLLVASGTGILYRDYYSPAKMVPRITQEVGEAFSKLDVEINRVQNFSLKDQNKLTGFFAGEFSNRFSREGIEILVYRQDTLVNWSSNVFDAPAFYDTSLFRRSVVECGSGYYLVRTSRAGAYKIAAVQLLKYNYRFTNSYLPDGFFKAFSVPRDVALSLHSGKFPVAAADGKVLFWLNPDHRPVLPDSLQYLIFLIYLFGFLFLIAAMFSLYVFSARIFRGKRWLFLLAFTADVLLLRGIQFWFRFPSGLYNIHLFKPSFFASSEWLPSLGDFLINSLLLLQVGYLIYKYSPGRKLIAQYSNRIRLFLPLLFLVALIAGFHILSTLIPGLVLDSSISFRFENILILSHLSHSGILIISLLLVAFLFLVELAARAFSASGLTARTYVIYLLTAGLIYAFILLLSAKDQEINLLFLVALLGILFSVHYERPFNSLNISRIIAQIIVLSMWATVLVNAAETRREAAQRVLMAGHLADARDNLAEYYFTQAARQMMNDSLQLSPNHDSLSEIFNPEGYIKQKYFTGYWQKYQVQVTVCQPGKQLSIKPGNQVTDCNQYFEAKIRDFMRPVSSSGLYFLRQSVDAMYYLGKIPVVIREGIDVRSATVYIEISSNEVWKGLGYPELLNDSRTSGSENLAGYSYAFYSKGELIKNFGKYSYNLTDQNYTHQRTASGFFTQQGYSHYLYHPDKETTLLVSAEKPRQSDLVSPFSYLFLQILFIVMIIKIIDGFSTQKRSAGINTFRFRMQLIMISAIVASSVVLVLLSLLFINKLNTNKNQEILNEKLNSVLVDLESRYAAIPSFSGIPTEELQDLLLQLSNTYFTDINLYNASGNLLASSRDQIFREGMLSAQMEPAAAGKLMVGKSSLFIQNERIGNYKFLSAYSAVRNLDNHLVGYVNLPYFARQQEIRREISGMISAFSNIYLIMIVLTVLLTLLLSRYMTRPLLLIGNQFSRVRIGDSGAKIEWKRKDEIGRLVDEYNRMIDKLEQSAELLARSERESAWRQMAQQVAHEIKNPLTPIKLSMQLLMRAWDDQVPDWDVRLKRFSQTLILQIDTLSGIATEFSDFAQMPEPQMRSFDLITLVHQSAELYRDQSFCEIRVLTTLGECFVLADPNQILRVFNNLIKNSLQAIPADRQGSIEIRIDRKEPEGFCEISFRDNGSGIPEDMQTRIFSPNFTTKTAGMGLGLAMVKNIIDSSRGRIRFETHPGEGTTFYIQLPLGFSGNDELAG